MRLAAGTEHKAGEGLPPRDAAGPNCKVGRRKPLPSSS